MRWSSWQIEWFLQREGANSPRVTHETIYRYIYSHGIDATGWPVFLKKKLSLPEKYGIVLNLKFKMYCRAPINSWLQINNM